MTDIQTRLATPFPSEYIKQVPSGGGQADYVPWTTVAQVIILVAGAFDWRVTAVTYSPSGDAVTVSGDLTTRRENGDAVTTSGVNYSEAYTTSGGKAVAPNPAAAESDAFKRAAAKQGIGLHLWTGDDPYWLDKELKKTAKPLADPGPPSWDEPGKESK